MLHDSGHPEFWMGACNPLLRLRYPTRPQPACTLGSWTTLTYREKPIPKLAKRKRAWIPAPRRCTTQSASHQNTS